MKTQLLQKQEECESWHDKAETLKWYNTILKHTIRQLKSPELISKYE